MSSFATCGAKATNTTTTIYSGLSGRRCARFEDTIVVSREENTLRVFRRHECVYRGRESHEERFISLHNVCLFSKHPKQPFWRSRRELCAENQFGWRVKLRLQANRHASRVQADLPVWNRQLEKYSLYFPTVIHSVKKSTRNL